MVIVKESLFTSQPLWIYFSLSTLWLFLLLSELVQTFRCPSNCCTNKASLFWPLIYRSSMFLIQRLVTSTVSTFKEAAGPSRMFHFIDVGQKKKLEPIKAPAAASNLFFSRHRLVGDPFLLLIFSWFLLAGAFSFNSTSKSSSCS